MAIPSSPDFDTTKLTCLKSFALDEGLDKLTVDWMIYQIKFNANKTFSNIHHSAKIRLVWSLIRCGVYYLNHKFYITIDHKKYEGDLEYIVSIIFLPLSRIGKD